MSTRRGGVIPFWNLCRRLHAHALFVVKESPTFHRSRLAPHQLPALTENGNSTSRKKQLGTRSKGHHHAPLACSWGPHVPCGTEPPILKGHLLRHVFLSASAAGEKHALNHGNELVEDESHGITSRPTHAGCWLRHATGGSLYWSITNHNKIK